MEKLFRTEIERNDRSFPTTGLSVKDAASKLRQLKGESDVTFTASQDGSSDKVIVTVTGDMAFIGLDRLDGIFQFATHDHPVGSVRQFVIGGQETDVEPRFVVDVSAAATVVQEWLTEGEWSSLGTWERQ
jgi:hypothetical protein